ncbi:MAG: sigma-70 family RNA polymerase sigma factor [Lachnospiraceae bacterium]|nr:sigma-70 family RNA polymerase sigma factor [Lachnospiraceae bacterium]
MEDTEIIALYWARDERAVSETAEKYGRYCHSVAYRILQNKEDSEECVNDTYTGAWNTIPPHRPELFSAFLAKITRRISLNRLRNKTAERRGSGQYTVTLEELTECIPSSLSAEDTLETHELTRIINKFLDGLPTDERRVFLCRYWYLDPIKDIAKRFSFGESKVKMMLKRTREKLLIHLEKEGITL